MSKWHIGLVVAGALAVVVLAGGEAMDFAEALGALFDALGLAAEEPLP